MDSNYLGPVAANNFFIKFCSIYIYIYIESVYTTNERG